ncbi:hypothetical protein WIS52_01925 [Pseudonocardia nematodicida]|uniref:Uncharacterized protein n=1 Tax=Pseudonocardia nematodicida TaxID=1206997 RepID=A0ABV1K430_9PSEU
MVISSPAAGPAPEGRSRVRDDFPAMPSVVHFRWHGDQHGWFVVVDPDTRHRILDDGSVQTGPGLVSTVVAAFVGSADRRARLSRTVHPHDERAWRLCDLAAQIAICPTWNDGTVDVNRQLPAILWSAVGRALAVEQRRADGEQALEHESLRDAAHETMTRVRDEERSLDEVERSLREVLTAATAIRQRREDAARAEAAEQARSAEELELRRRLDIAAVDDTSESDRQADRTAGLAAEVTAVSTLLADADRMLRDIEPGR